ncbi:MAG: SIP domain-containing protein [Myxococcota bacterium]
MDPEVESEAWLLLDHVNAAHPDAVAFVVAHLGGNGDAIGAAWTGLDAGGLEATVEGTNVRMRFAFASPLTDGAAVYAEVVRMVLEARGRAPEGAPPTSLEQELARHGEQAAYAARLVARRDLCPGLFEVTLSTTSPMPRSGVDAFFLAAVPAPGAPDLDPTLKKAAVSALVAQDEAHAAYYTVRRAEGLSLTVWVVRHADQGVGGWFDRAPLGASLLLFGTRHAYRPPPDPQRVFVLADPSAFGAAAAILADLPPRVPATLLLQGPRPDDAAMGTRAQDVTFASRDDATQLQQLADLDITPRDYVYGGGQDVQVKAWRHHLRRERRLPGAAVGLLTYWRR